ncbi:hypothetical protein PGB28_16385 [Primorskyibacter aestuariivivens]|uniref:hypothetical protein n=1 Tax=Primorskyibacter aestuariivivens TaxID=1888912 RepID=UPI0022FFD333|nr:hypothetical protein [Primorskyibacter aestuariivivens]MDA7430045.1 hypothetical protein [Primorskyibacter aestuariivivens]
MVPVFLIFFCCANLFVRPAVAEIDSRFKPFLYDSTQPTRLFLRGRLTLKSQTDFIKALNAYPQIKTFSLHGPGGSVFAAIPIAYAIRDAGLDTLIERDHACESACSFLFLAGVERQALGALGVHAMQTSDPRSREIAMAEVAALFDYLGVSGYVLDKLAETPSDRMYVFSRDELYDNALVTGTRPVEPRSDLTAESWPLTQCDVLASDPWDPLRARETAAIPSEELDYFPAIGACQAEIRENPGNLRALYQYVRAALMRESQETPQVETDTGKVIPSLYVRVLLSLSQRGYVAAQSEWAFYLSYGFRQVAQDVEEAEKWGLKAAESGYAEAQVRFGQFLSSKAGGRRHGEALIWFEKAAEQDYVPGLYLVGLAHLRGQGTEKDETAASNFFRAAMVATGASELDIRFQSRAGLELAKLRLEHIERATDLARSLS